ncbi:DMT family transporter [Microbacterium sp. SCN 71-21]|uniref:DMT family transporter n=1 Tax=Microbacterium sp. SCN 71-21 TaxID=1660116 RepID=UPI00339031FB
MSATQPVIPEHRRMPRAVALGGAVAVGILTALQARVNGSLGHEMGDGFVAAFVSFSSGFVILVVLSLALPAGRAGLRRLATGVRHGHVPIWMLLGGLAGALTVATQGLTVAIIGVALFTVGVVAGQTVNGLVLDRVGYGPAGVVPLTWGRIVGGAVVLAAVVVLVSSEGTTAVPWWMLLLPFVSGAGIAWQQATNGRLRQAVESPLTATLVNFAGGTAALAIAGGVHGAISGLHVTVPGAGWLYLGGAIGVVYIFLSAALVRHTGVLLLGLGSVVGLLATSVTLDAIWPPESGPNPAIALAGVVVALAGVVIAAARRRQRA